MSRPRLADHVVARLFRRGDDERLVLLDARDDRAVVLAATAWSVLCHADGSRDVAGIAAAARRFGADVGQDTVAHMFADLQAFGWVADGAPDLLLEGLPQPVAPDDMRPVHEMVAARYRCDGRGGCCGVYPTISLTPTDVPRVCATMADDHVLAHRQHRVFLPTFGSAPTPMRAMTLVDGACRFLEGDGACGVHRRGGAEAKPIGCAWYPTRIVDDGHELRAAPAIECACPARPDPTAAPLLPAVRGCDLPLGITLLRVPARVAYAVDGDVARDVAIAAIERLRDVVEDPPRGLWTWARALEHASDWCDPTPLGPIDPERVARRFASVARRAAVRLGVETTWRGPDEAVVRRLETIALAARLLAAPTAAALVTSNVADALERHALDVAIFGRTLLVTDDLARAAEDLALQMWLARATAAFVDERHDVTLRETPLAAVTATWRAQRLGD